MKFVVEPKNYCTLEPYQRGKRYRNNRRYPMQRRRGGRVVCVGNGNLYRYEPNDKLHYAGPNEPGILRIHFCLKKPVNIPLNWEIIYE